MFTGIATALSFYAAGAIAWASAHAAAIAGTAITIAVDAALAGVAHADAKKTNRSIDLNSNVIAGAESRYDGDPYSHPFK